MKRTLFQLFNLLMACIVLLSSTGFGLVEHSCQMRGKKRTLVVVFSETSQGKTCVTGKHNTPPPAGQTVIKKTECCQDEQHYDNVDTSSSLSQLVAKVVKSVAEAVLLGAVTLLTYLVGWLFDSQTTLSAQAASPPFFRSGRTIVTLVHSLLI
ncbi:hypothetical protein GCM10027578_38200 [Spirosoma luteolum]